MGASRGVEVQLKHLVSVDTQWSRNTRVYEYRVWSEPAARPSPAEEPAEAVITCGDCDAAVTYRLWTVARTRRRRRIWAGLALGSLAILLISVVLLVRGSLGDYGILVLPVACGAVFGFAAASANEKGIRCGRATRPDGGRAGRHRVDVKHLDDVLPPP